MTKTELFKLCNINESHKEWDNMIDNWVSVEIYRIMHEGRLPDINDNSVKYIYDFNRKMINDEVFRFEIHERDDWGSLFLTSKRMIYRYADMILKEL